MPKVWTLDELHALPDDGNKYELVRGELLVTPAPTFNHETVASRLAGILDRYVEQHQLGIVFRPRAIMRFMGSEVEPDWMLLPPVAPGTDWDTAPTPILVVEVLSSSSRRGDRIVKRQLYGDAGVGEYWIVDSETRSFTVIRSDTRDLVVSDEMRWHPAGANHALTFEVAAVFGRK